MKKDRSLVAAFVAWFVVGSIAAGTIQILRSGSTGGAEGLVFAGKLEPAHVVVVEHLPGAPVDDGHGHDGQIFYAIGADITASNTHSAIVPPYRYRRILYPALASLFGVLDGEGLLWGMILLASASAGLAAGAMAGIGSALRRAWLAPLTLVLNPGIWLSAMFLTADNLAFAFSLLAVLAILRRKDGWAIVALIAAALTRETHLMFAVSLAGYLWFRGERARSLRVFFYPTLLFGLWLIYVAVRLGNPLVSGNNLEFPLVGMYQASGSWGGVSGLEQFFTAVTLMGIGLSFLTLLFRRALTTWLVAPWIILALLSSHFVWDLGNNSIRTLAPLFTLGLFGLLRETTENVERSKLADSGTTLRSVLLL